MRCVATLLKSSDLPNTITGLFGWALKQMVTKVMCPSKCGPWNVLVKESNRKAQPFSSCCSLSRHSSEQPPQQAAPTTTIRVSVAGGEEVDPSPFPRARHILLHPEAWGAPPPRVHDGVFEKREAGNAGHGHRLSGVRPRPRFSGRQELPGWRMGMPSWSTAVTCKLFFRLLCLWLCQIIDSFCP
jgi:hypothetical protein